MLKLCRWTVTMAEQQRALSCTLGMRLVLCIVKNFWNLESSDSIVLFYLPAGCAALLAILLKSAWGWGWGRTLPPPRALTTPDPSSCLREYPSASIISSVPSSWTRQFSSLTCKGSPTWFSCICPGPATHSLFPPGSRLSLYRQKEGAAISCLDTSSHTQNWIWAPLQAVLVPTLGMSIPTLWPIVPWSSYSTHFETPLFLKATRFYTQSQPLSTAMPSPGTFFPPTVVCPNPPWISGISRNGIFYLLHSQRFSSLHLSTTIFIYPR